MDRYMQIYRVPALLWTHARFPEMLVPKGYGGVFVVAASLPENRASRKREQKMVEGAAQRANMAAEWSDKYRGWIVQFMAPHEMAA